MVMALDGVKVVDLSRLAPGPYCSMLLADFGADVTLIEAAPGVSDKLADNRSQTPEQERIAAHNALRRGKKSIALNLKDDRARDVFFRMIADADVVIEGFRPGVVKRLGVDYDTVHARNSRAVYCSVSGFGQTGPYSNLVGHDINYIAVGGALSVTGNDDERPSVPANIVADFAGGGLMAAFSICVALLARDKTGEGQYVDIGMSDGVFYLMASAYSGLFSSGNVTRKGNTTLTGSSPWYGTYRCSDGRWFSLGSIEPHFYQALTEVTGLAEFAGKQHDQSVWPAMRERLTSVFATRTAADWMAAMSQRDICAAPAYTMDEAATNEHNLARGMVVEVDSPFGRIKQPGIGPKLSATPGAIRSIAPKVGEHTHAVLASLGYPAAEIQTLRAGGAVA